MMIALALPTDVGTVTGLPDLVTIGASTFFVAELGELEVEAALELRHGDAQRRTRRVRENLRSRARERAHLAADAEHRLIEGQRLVHVVRRVNSVHQSDDAGFVRGIRHGRLGADDAEEQAGRCDHRKNAHRASLLFIRAG
jgi:hypothetical protein